MLHLVHNPVAGRGRARDAARAVRDALEARGIDSRIWTTEHRGHATELALSLPDDATVVAIGGDGTVHEVAKACIGNGRLLGVVPTGSGDDFAHALGLPRGRIEPAVEVLAGGRVRTVDTGICNAEPFVNAVGVGFDAEVGHRVAEAPRPLSGLGAYLWSVAVCLRDLCPVRVRIESDGRLVYEGPSLLASCMNGPRAGGSFRFAPKARLDDGRLDVLIGGSIGRLGTVGLLPRVMLARHLSHPHVRHLQAQRVVMRWEAPRAWHTEGETFAPHDRFEIDLRPASLRVLAP
jgi:YegS/Rv2252/BmrU family lipid kinase